MYARSLRERGRSVPPPGYNGTAFGASPDPVPPAIRRSDGQSGRQPDGPSDGLESKRHTPDEYGGERPAAIEPAAAAQAPIPAPDRNQTAGFGSLTALFGDLRGRIGAEELILLLVMLLMSADGAGVETLLLGVVLLAGRGE